MQEKTFHFKVPPHSEWLKQIGLGVKIFEFLKIPQVTLFDEIDVEDTVH